MWQSTCEFAFSAQPLSTIRYSHSLGDQSLNNHPSFGLLMTIYSKFPISEQLCWNTAMTEIQYPI